MRLAIALVGVAFLSFLLSSQPAIVIADDDAWLVAPPVVKELSAADWAARGEVVKVIAGKQAKRAKVGWNLEVPERASGLPARYDLIIHRNSGCFVEARARLEIKIFADQAHWELCDLSGIYRTERPAAEVDRLARRLAYAYHAAEPPGKKRNYGMSFSIGPPPHDFELVSRDPKRPFHLQPDHPQVERDSGGAPTERIRNHVFAILVEQLFPIAERECTKIPAAEEAREVLERLKAVPALTEFRKQAEHAKDSGLSKWSAADDQADAEDKQKYSSGRRDQIWVERSLYGDMAVKHALKEALPELKRLLLIDEQRQLAIATSADPKPLILQAIADHEDDWQLASWAENYAADENHPARLQWLIDVLPLLETETAKESRAQAVFFLLRDRALSKEQITQLAALFNKTGNQALQIGLARELLTRTHEAPYFAYLERLVRTLPPDKDTNERSPRRTAAEALLSYSADNGKHRAEAYAILQLLLGEMRSTTEPDSFEMFQLVGYLGTLGSANDVPYLTKLAKSDSVYLSSYAIEALANIKPAAALVELHERLARLNRGQVDSHDYSHEVYSHFSLIVFERDTAALPLLKKAWEKLNAPPPPKPPKPVKKPRVDEVIVWESEEPEDDEPLRDFGSYGYNPAHVIAFLEAKTGSARAEAAIAHFGDRAHYEDRARMQRLVDQLVKDGADPERCKVLLQVPDERRRGR